MKKVFLSLFIGAICGSIGWTYFSVPVVVNVTQKEKIVELPPKVDPAKHEQNVKYKVVTRTELPVEKNWTKRYMEMRLYAEDGTYMINTLDHVQIGFEKGDTITSAEWFQEK